LDEESMSLKTYLPGVRTAPGICMGSVMVMIVFLFQASAVALMDTKAAPSAAMQHRVMIPLRVFISFFLLVFDDNFTIQEASIRRILEYTRRAGQLSSGLTT
jgi:hypothetical protein